MLRSHEHVPRCALLHHDAFLHHQHAVANLCGDTQIMRDEQDGDVEFRLKLVKQLKHLRLHRNIERGNGLVAYQHFRIKRQRARDADALPLATGKFVRVTRQHVRTQAHQRH